MPSHSFVLALCVGVSFSFVLPPVAHERRTRLIRNASPIEFLNSIEDTVESGGPAAAYALVALADSIPLLPTQPITIATGAAFGLTQGLAIVAAGQATAALLCFVIGRTLLGPERIERWFGKTVVAVVNEATNAENFASTVKSIIILRQSPVVPFSVGNYALGAATTAPIQALLTGTIIGCLPLNILYTATGAAVRDGALAAIDSLGFNIEQAEEALGFLGILATVAIAYTITQAVQKVREDDDGSPLLPD